MNFLRKLFGGTEETPEEEKKVQEARNFDVLKYDGVAALRQNAFDYAIKCFRCALDLQEDAETRDYLAQALIHTNEMREAFEQLEHLSETEPDNVRIQLRMADVAYMMEDYDAMTEVCERANTIDSENAMVNYSYARARIGKVDFVCAIALLSKAITLSKETPFWDAYLLRGQTLLKMNDVPLAEKDADYLLEHIADNEDILLLKARCREADGDHEGALEAYGKVVEADPFNVDAFKERAAVRQTLGDEQGAAEDLQIAEDLSRQTSVQSDEEGGETDVVRQTEEAYRSINPFG
ncbi:MAG: tetratricopeptide repeat protein [Prevotella sp.]|nr:tetratricopeptide repeat protein [Prevotella sp.]